MASSRRKQDEKNLKVLRELGSQPANRTCFDCHQRGTTYINMTVGSFVCTSCSGILRGLNPPHRVKSISMATFTQEEIDQIKSKGNQYCSAVWLGLYDAKLSPFPDTKDENKIREFMITKYEKKRFYVDPSIALKNMPPQTPSATSSTASTPNSDIPKSGPPAASASVSRPSVPPSQCGRGRWQERKPILPPLKMGRPDEFHNFPLSPPKSSGSVSGGLVGSKASTPKSSTSLDLLADLAAPPDPFASPTSQSTTAASIPSFANFENANIFTNTTADQPSQNQSPQDDDPFSLTPPPSPFPSRSPSRSPTPSSSSRSSSDPWDDDGEINPGTPLIPIADSFMTPPLVGDASTKTTNKGKSSNPPVVFASGVSAQFVCPSTNTGGGWGLEDAHNHSSRSSSTSLRHSSSNNVLPSYSKEDRELTAADALLGGERSSSPRLNKGSTPSQENISSSKGSPFMRRKKAHSPLGHHSYSYSSLDLYANKMNLQPELGFKDSSDIPGPPKIGAKSFAAFLLNSKRIGASYQNLRAELKKSGVVDKKTFEKKDKLDDGGISSNLEKEVSKSLDFIADDNTNKFANESADLSSSSHKQCPEAAADSSVVAIDPPPLKKPEASKPIPIAKRLLAPTGSSSCPMPCPLRASPPTNPFVSFLQPATNPHQDSAWGGRTGGSLGRDSGSDAYLHECLKQQQKQQCDNSMTPADYLLAGTTTTSNKPTHSGPHLPFSSNPLTPMTPNSSSHTSSTALGTQAVTNAAQPANRQPAQDRYAALKDLDEEFKTQKETETISNGVSWPIPNGGQQGQGQSGGVFGGPGTMNGAPGAFGSPSNGVFGTMNGAAGAGNAGVMGTPPTTNNAWANFSGPNPFSGCNNSGSPWMNGGVGMGGPPPQHQGFGTMVQPNPFGATPDPNFNQFSGGNVGTSALNGSSVSGGGNPGTGWANFPPNNKMQWMAANGTANAAANPFMAATQMPSSGSSYNPFL